VVSKLTLANGETRYEARWREPGRDRRQRFRTKRDADAAVQAARDRGAKRKAGITEERGPLSYSELVELFLAQFDGRSSGWRAEMLAYSTAKFASVPVRELRPERIGAWLNSLPHAPKTRQHILDSMRQVLNAGVEWDYLAKNPARPQAVRGPSQVEHDVRPFGTWDEVERVATAAGPFGALILFACATGLRPQEWIALRWQEIELERRALRVDRVCVDGVVSNGRAKTEGSLRTVQLQQRALDALASLPSPLRRDQLLFPSTRGGLIDLDNWRQRVWRKTLEKAELEHRPLYQMRHTFATLALSAGADIYWVSKQLGHSDIRTTLKFYARFERAVDDRNLRLLDSFAA